MTEITVVGAGGEYMESVVVVEWLKKLGDTVKTGDLVVVVETAKAATEIESPVDGILSEIRAEVGEEIAIGTVLGIIDDGTSNKSASHVAPQAPALSPTVPEPPSVAKVSASPQRVVASPLARRVATQMQIDLSKVAASSPSGRIKLRDLETYATDRSSWLKVPAAETLPVPANQSTYGTKIFIQRRGPSNGERLVLIHGFGGDSLSWQPVLAALGSGFDVALVDLPAHGRSTRPNRGLSVQEMAAAVSDSLAEAAIDDFHLVGHSLGGAVSLALTARGRNSIRSLTLIAPAGLGPEIDGGFISGFARSTRAESLAPWIARLFVDQSLASPAFVAATMQARSDEGLREAQTLLAGTVFPDGTQAADLRDVLKASMVPQKIIWGQQDRIIPMHHAMGVGAQAAVHFIAGVGHMPQIEAPAIVARLLEQNIRSAS